MLPTLAGAPADSLASVAGGGAYAVAEHDRDRQDHARGDEARRCSRTTVHVANDGDHARDEAHDRDDRARGSRCACPSAASRAMRARRARTGSSFTTTIHPCVGERLLDRAGQVGERERDRAPGAGSRRSTSRDARSGSARKRTSTSGCSVEKQRTPAARISASTGYGNAAHARRAAIDSITGLPKPSHVDGNTTRSHAAYASATRRRAAERDRHLGPLDDARRACRRSRLRPGRRSRACTGRSAIACARCAARRTAPGTFLRSIARDGCSITNASSAKPNCGAGRGAVAGLRDRDRRSCGRWSRPRSRALRARGGCAG